jgi:hypothetical protein
MYCSLLDNMAYFGSRPAGIAGPTLCVQFRTIFGVLIKLAMQLTSSLRLPLVLVMYWLPCNPQDIIGRNQRLETAH